MLITFAANEVFRATELLRAIRALCNNCIWLPLDTHVLVKPGAGAPEVVHVIGASFWFEVQMSISICTNSGTGECYCIQ